MFSDGFNELPSKTRETTLLPANEQSGGGGDEQAGVSITSIFIYITI